MEQPPKSYDWSNCCARIFCQCMNAEDSNNCTCYKDYCIWSKDNPKMDFAVWKNLVYIEYKQHLEEDC